MGYQAGDDAWILWGIKFNMYKILLVDDEILVRDAIRENIDWKSLDCELVGDCENGRQAVEFCAEPQGGCCIDRYLYALYGWYGTERVSS